MEILTASLLSTCILFIFLIAFRLIDLIKQVNKQQEQIDSLYQQNIRLSNLTVHMNKVSMDIATKVIDIEKRVDNLNK